MAEKKKVHYVDNKKFLAAIVERKVLLKEAEEEGESIDLIGLNSPIALA